jgi:uncharacterized protein YndB with AHSA1/START domain
VRCAAPPARAWQALTDAGELRRWFGVLRREPGPAGGLRLEFGDGDFFALQVEQVEHPELRWTWRFMGIGPVDQLEARVHDCGEGSLVTVVDRRAGRSREEGVALGEGWSDFLSRLQRFLATGENARYAWRGEVEVWIELPVPAPIARRELILSAADWLPLPPGAANLLSAEALLLSDGVEPSSFPLHEIRGDGPGSVRFAVRLPHVEGQLSTRIEITGDSESATLALTQSGFPELGADEAVKRRVRARFAEAWVQAARRAEALLAPAPVAAGN